MRIQVPDIKVLKGANDFEETVCGVSNLGLLMQYMRKDMYSNRPRIIPQELMSNARDAHREVGRGKEPIVVQLPTEFDPNLYIKDNGPSVDPARMVDVFIQYCASTKRDSDDQTGGYGVGAKTPLAYGNQFGVVTTTWHDDFTDSKSGKRYKNCFVRRQYVVYIDDTLQGMLAKAGEDVCEGPSGTTVVVSIKPNDFNRFRAGVVRSAKFWDVRPIIEGDPAFEWPAIENHFEGKDGDWFIPRDHCLDHDEQGVHVIVDGIPYPVDLAAIEAHDNDRLDSECQSLLHRNLYMRFKVGELRPALTREKLDYGDDEMNTRILDRIRKAYRELGVLVEKEIADAPNLWDAILRFNEIGPLFAVENCEWQGVKANRSVISFPANLWAFNRRPGGSCRLDKHASQITVSKDNLVLIDETGEGTYPNRARVRTVMNEHDIQRLYVLRRYSPPTPTGTDPTLDGLRAEKFAKDAADIEDKFFLSKFGFGQFGNYEKTKTERRARVPITQVYTCEYGRFRMADAVDVDLENQIGFVVPLHKRIPIVLNSERRHNFDDLMEDLGITGDRLWGVPKRFIGKVKKCKGLVLLDDAILAARQKVLDDPLYRFVGDAKIFSLTMFKQWAALAKMASNGLGSEIDDGDNIFMQYFRASKNAPCDEYEVARLHSRAIRLGISKLGKVKNAESTRLAALQRQFRRRYPLLIALDGYQIPKVPPAEIALYINIKDMEALLPTDRTNTEGASTWAASTETTL